MRLLFLGPAESPLFVAWPRHFAAAGHEVHVLHTASARVGEGVRASYEEAAIGWHGPPLPLRVGVRGAWRAAALTVARVTWALRPAVVHSHGVVPSGWLAHTARARPHVATAWGSEVLLGGPRQRRLVAAVARGADLLTADSHHLLDELAVAGAPSDRLRFSPWGVDRDWRERAAALSRQQAAARLGLPADRPLALLHRGTAAVYDPATAIEALAIARHEVEELCGLLLADPPPIGPPEPELRELAARHGVGPDDLLIRPKLAHEDVGFAYRAATVCVSIPRSDSAPTSVFEALALGIPAVVSDLPWVREPPYREARLGVAPVGDAPAVAAAIVERATRSNPADLEANRRLVEEHLDRGRLFAGIGAEYERLAAGRSSRTRSGREPAAARPR